MNVELATNEEANRRRKPRIFLEHLRRLFLDHKRTENVQMHSQILQAECG